MRKVKGFIKLLCLLFAVALMAELRADDYDIVERYKLVEDRVRTYEMMNPMRHDFIFDITAMLNQDVLDVIDDGDAISDGGTEAEQLARAEEFLNKYNKTEQNMRFALNLGVPLPSFSLFRAKIRPSVRAHVSLGVILGIRTGEVTVQDIINNLTGVPDEIKTTLNACNFTGISDGADIVVYARDTAGCITAQEAQLVGTGKYFYKDIAQSIPNLYSYAKGEGRVGLNFDYVKGKHWFGNFSLYGMGRADAFAIVTEESLAGNGEVGSLNDEMNTTITLNTDLRFGYRNGRLRGWAAIEELKLNTASDNVEKGGELVYGTDPLLRLHGEYIYRYSGFSVKPFAGVHKRSGYGFADGLYAGGDLGLHFWGNRLGMRVRGMLDKEQFTFGPQLKLWLMHIDYMLKLPVKSEVDGVKPATVHALNFRIFI